LLRLTFDESNEFFHAVVFGNNIRPHDELDTKVAAWVEFITKTGAGCQFVSLTPA
jgi:hypothetical protein